MVEQIIDILENELYNEYPEAFEKLLIDHTTHKNIFWATNDYQKLGEGYGYDDEITLEKITGEHGKVVVPRALKLKAVQDQRSKDMAEVFTPSWVCNAQNNLVDEAWFGRKDVFNVESIEEDGKHTWKATTEPITDFPEGKTWKDYVRDTRLEITCGEAPYLCSRYDTTTGEYIPLEQRIGLLDRKLRLISENCDNSGDWLEMAQEAYKNIYGYEWQGDNLLLARESLLVTFIEYYHAKFGKKPVEKSVSYIAYIISWNLWQMDGLKLVVPNSCDKVFEETAVFGELDFDFDDTDSEKETSPKKKECPGCKNGTITGHIGQKCVIRDWKKTRPKSWTPKPGEENEHNPWQKIFFISLLKQQ